MLKKGFFDRVFTPCTTLDSKTLLDTERSMLFAIMAQHGFNISTFRNRLFYIGFKQWMITGVDALKDGFAKLHPELEAWRKDKRSFMALIEDLKIPKGEFYNYMCDAGMTSQITVKRRFKDEDWQNWEKRGIKSILTEYCKLGN